MRTVLPFKYRPFVIGMVHVGPLPGSPIFEGDLEVAIDEAVRNALALEEGGVDGVLVENFYDVPYPSERADPATVASLSLIVREVKKAVSIPVGVNVLRNCCLEALAIAYINRASYIRVNALAEVVVSDQGILAPKAYDLTRYKRYLGAAGVALLADVHVKHAAPLAPRPIDVVAREAVERGLADAVIISGEVTGSEASIEEVAKVKKAVPDTPVIVGSGVMAENAVKYLSIADGAIVGTYFKVGRHVDKDRVRRLLDAIKSLRRAVS